MSLATISVGDAELDLSIRHAAMRLAVSVSVSFVMCEFLEWTPAFVGPLLAVVIQTNLPTRPTLKVILGLTLVMAAATYSVYTLTVLLHGMPIVQYGLLALGVFLAFYGLTSGKPALPLTLLLIALTLVPVVTMVAPAQGIALPKAFVRGILVALVSTWLVHLVWPRVPPREPKPPPPAHPAPPLLLALLASAVVLPLMLVYMLFGFANALPVMVGTLLLVLNFDVQRGFHHGFTLIVGNFAGGMFGMFLFALLLTTPWLPFLGTLLFVSMLWFARAVVLEPKRQAVAVIACKAMLVILGSSISAGAGSLSLWLTRVGYFTLAGAFALCMMSALWYWAMPRWAPDAGADAAPEPPR